MKRYHVSKNLYNKNDDTLLYSATNLGASNLWRYGGTGITIRIPCDADTTYTFACNIDTSIWRLSTTDSSDIPITDSPVSTSDLRRSITEDGIYTFTTGTNTQYILFQVAGSDIDTARQAIMLNTGLTALPYEPYGNEWQTKSPPNYGTGTDTVTNLPVEIFTDGQPVSSYTLKGNTQTSGTPSPQNPVTIQGVGEETANLFDFANNVFANGILNDNGEWQSSTSSKYTTTFTEVDELTTYTLSRILQTNTYFRLYFYDNSKNWISRSTFWYNTSSFTFTTPANCKYIQFQCSNADTGENWMLNTGSTALSYEPYGYKISILKDSQPLTPIYLSQPLRKSLDGTAFDTLDSTGLVTYNVDEYGQPQTATTETVTVPTITTMGGTVTLDVDTTVKPSELDLTYHGWHEHEPLKRENGAWV